jgi:hypothetical protein
MAAPVKLTKPAGTSWPQASGRAGSSRVATADSVEKKHAPSSAVVELRRKTRSSDILGVAWMHGALYAASFRRQTVLTKWEAATPVRTMEDFATALDEAIVELKFTGTEIFCVLAHDEFVHQTESAPDFSEKAARAYLRGRVERLEQEREPLLWVWQRAAVIKKESNHILHLLPVAFYHKLNEILLARRLDLTRILPLHIPLQLALSTLTETRDMPLLVATAAGSATSVLVGKTGSDLLFSRTILESWSNDAPRVAVEINRSLLYAKQQFGTNVDFLWLLGKGAEQAQAEVSSKCGKASDVVVEDNIGPVDWLKSIVKLSPRHPVNLVGSFLRQKRRGRFLRRLAMAACWLGLALLGFDAWNDEQAWTAELARLQGLAANEENLTTERERLAQRNTETAQRRAFVQIVRDDRLPPVAAKFLAFVATVLPREASLTNFSTKWNEENGAWEFEFDGSLEADPETAALMTASLRRQLANGPFRARIQDTVRRASTIVVGGASSLQQFSVEGVLFEN